jgi:hypothetical protein
MDDLIYFERTERITYTATLFETLDYIPVVSIANAVIRDFIGFVEVIAGIVFLPIQLGRRIVSRNPGPDHFLIIRGISDIFRAKVAVIPFAGNMALYAYDHYLPFKNEFRQIFGIY